MAPAPYSFIDVTVLEDVRERFAAGHALAILDVALEKVIWANGAGATLLGYPDIDAVMGAPSGLSLPARRQISSAPGFPHAVHERQVMVRVASGLTSRTVPFTVSALVMPDREQGVLIAVATPADRTQTVSRIIDGFGEAGYFAAFLNADASVEAATSGFDGLGIDGETLAGLVAEVAHESNRLVKRLIPARGGRIPAGIARLTDMPSVHLLLAVNEVVPEIAATEMAPAIIASPVAGDEDGELPAPSDADFLERLDEDMAAEDRRDLVPAEDEDATDPADLEPSATGDEEERWYFDHGAQPAVAGDADSEASTVQPDYRGTPPIRFIWRTDATGAISSVSDEFLSALGQDRTALIGHRFGDVAAILGLDPDKEITALLERRDTWSGRTVMWPIAGTRLRAPVDLAALPTYDRNRSFEGFRGFGVVRLAEAVGEPQPSSAPLVTPESAHAPDESNEDAELNLEDPFKGEVPAISIAGSKDRRTSDKIIRLAEHRPAPTSSRMQLSPGERTAFEEIRARLRKDYAAALDKARNEQASSRERTDQPDFLKEMEPETEAAGNDNEAREESIGLAVAASDAEGPAKLIEPHSEQDAGVAKHAPEIATEGFVPSAFFVSRSVETIDAELLSQLPLPVLVHSGDDLYFANQEFFSLTGYSSLAQIRNEGGLDRLFVEREELTPSEDGKLHLRTLGGDQFPVDAHLQSIRWEGRSALLLSLRRVPDANAGNGASRHRDSFGQRARASRRAT
jgi:PAS domain-containing protein